MIPLTYEDYKARLNIQTVLQDAGYHLNRRDGLRYPSYVRLDSDGRRIRGDKFIVTANGLCCFHPPERKNYNVISFIKEHPDMFAEYTPGMSTDRLVNVVCCRLLNQPLELRNEHILDPVRDVKPFKLDDYEVTKFDRKDWDSQKPFYPYFKARGIDITTQRAFADNILLTAKHREDGKKFTNLSFPLSIPDKDGIVGLEERSRPNAEGKTAYKGKAAGTNSSEGMWIANITGKPLGEVDKVMWFESAYDAMAYYQINKTKGVYISTGGNPGDKQFSGMLKAAPQAEHRLCFDRDTAGQSYVALFESVKEKQGLTATKSVVDSANEQYKDWNDQLMDKKIENEQTQRPHFRR